MSSLSGRCLCGAVRYEVRGAIDEAHHCHCSMCRRFHGAAFATYARVDRERLGVHGIATEFRSTPKVARSFCATCGSSLFFAHDLAPKWIWLAAGTLDDGAALAPDAHIYVGSKAAWCPIADALPQHDTQRPEYQRPAR